MTISTYDELKAAIADFLNRDDLASTIPAFIHLAEAQINRDVRHWQMEKRSSATFNERYEALPVDWLETVRVSISGKKQLGLMSQAKMMDMRESSNNTAGEPRYYAVSSSQLELYPTPDGNYDAMLIYIAKIDALSDSNTSNWLLQDAPDVYLYGALLHSAPFLADDGRMAVWQTLYANAVAALNRASDAGTYSGTGLVMR